MKRYIIKTHYVPTEKNPSFRKEDEHDTFTGIGTQTLTEYPDGHLKLSTSKLTDSNWLISEYGYKTITGARKGLKVMQGICDYEMSHGQWIASSEIVEVEI